MVSSNSEQSTEQTPLLSQPKVAPSPRRLSVISNASIHSYEVQPGLAYQELVRSEEVRHDSIPEPDTPTASVGRIICVLLIGSLISNADSSLLFATHPIIASEFNALHDSSWLMTTYGLAQAATLPLYGKLSDIYGRKIMLLLAYFLFATGCALVGVGGSMSILILGRVISGAGSSGMTSLISILITDLVPLRDVANWRSYVNVVATTGRSIGGPMGGWLADTVGWRWSFLGQIPLAGLGMVLIAITLPARLQSHRDHELQGSQLARIDFAGALMLTLSILSLLVPLEIGGVRVPWFSPTIVGLFMGAIMFGMAFLIIESRFAKEPIVPLPLLCQRDLTVSSFVMFFQCAAQTGMMFAVPLYFQVTAGSSNTVAGVHLVPAVVGNAIGGILSGFVISRTGRYKALVLIATLISSTAYLLLVLRWHGNTNWLESLYIFPGGFGMAIVQSALFISVQAAIDPAHTAIAASILYLLSSIGFLSGMAGVSSVLQETLRTGLSHRLAKLDLSNHEKWKIIKLALSDVHYIDKARPLIRKAVVESYIGALTWTHVLSLSCSLTAFLGSLLLRQHKI